MASFVYVSRQQAVAYRDHVRAREPYRLRDLAQWMASTSGPLEAADASFASLVPVWEWYVEFVLDGCPGMDPRLRMPFLTAEGNPKGWSGDRGELPSLGARAQAAAIGIEHYVRLVWQRFDPPAPWEIYVTPGRARTPDFIHYSTGVRMSNGGIWVIDTVYTSAGNVVDDRAHIRRPEGLLEQLLKFDLGWSEIPAQPSAPSVLAPLLGADLDPEPEQAAVSPVWHWPKDYWKATSDGERERPIGEEMTLWRGPVQGLDEAPALLEPLPAGDVAHVLAAHGFVGEHGAADATYLLTSADDEGFVELGHRREVGQIQVFVAEGAVRSLHVEPQAFTNAEWAAFTRDLRALARRIGARFMSDDRIGDD